MSTIGLYDQDLMNLGFCAPNLSLMKIAGYEKRLHHNLVNLVEQVEPTFYTKFYFAQDYPGTTNQEIISHPKVVLLGDQLTTNRLPQHILETKPDTSIYFKAYNRLEGLDYRLGQQLLEMEHLQLSLDGKTIWPNYPCQLKDWTTAQRFMIHDKDITAVDGAYETIINLLKKYPQPRQPVLATKYPIHIYNSQQLAAWASLPRSRHMCLFEIDYMIPREEWYFTAGRGLTAQLNLSAIASDEDDFVKRALPEIVSFVNFFRKMHHQILLIYDTDFLSSQRLANFIDLLNFYSACGEAAFSVIAFVNYMGNQQDMTESIEALRYIKLISPKTYELLKEKK